MMTPDNDDIAILVIIGTGDGRFKIEISNPPPSDTPSVAAHVARHLHDYSQSLYKSTQSQ